MSRKITKKMLLNLYLDRVEAEDDERRERRAAADRSSEEIVEFAKGLMPQLVEYLTKTYASSGSSEAATYSVTPSSGVPEEVWVDAMFSDLEAASPEAFSTLLSHLQPRGVASIGELHRRSAARRGRASGVPVVGVPIAPPAPMVGGLVDRKDLESIMSTCDATNAESFAKIQSMLQHLSLSELKVISKIFFAADENHRFNLGGAASPSPVRPVPSAS